ncbi:hypothetical protein FS749_015790 [Ceratobasidium sp. UAMH 11750]|nr:hypothetical protein FS749_015790 [Ceratobasidium sp. UAMH 11750]
MTSPTGTRSNIYSEAFRLWKSARDCLDAATKRYADACASLGAACSRPPTRDATQPMLEEVLTALDLELSNLTPRHELTANANKIIKVLRNRSTSLVRINALPSELLVRIFDLLDESSTASVDDTAMYPEALLRVSTSWRQTALDSAQLWTRITLAPLSQRGHKLLEQAETRLERACGSVLDLHIHEGPVWGTIDPRTSAFFARVAPRLCAISLVVPSRHQDPFLQHYLPVLIESGTPGSVYVLRLRGNRFYEFMASPSKFRSMERVEEFLAHIQYLTLRNVFIDWSSSVYQGLVELDLTFKTDFAHFPTVDEFTAILQASPQLCALKLHNFGLRPGSVLDATRYVRLDELEVLFLGNILRRSLKLFLPLLQPGLRPLYMRFRLPKRGTDFTRYAQLLKRSHVVKLMVEGTGEYPSQYLLASLTNVQDLLLVNFLIDSWFLQSMAEPLIRHAGGQHPSIWPHLRNLHLALCVFEDAELYNTFTIPIPFDFKLWVWALRELRGMDTDFCVNPTSLEGRRLLGQLTSYIPGMQDIESDQNVMPCAWASAFDFLDING